MRILVVASDFPWPMTQGGHLRLSTAIRALADIGPVDLFTLYDYRDAAPELPHDLEVARLKTVAHRGPASQIGWRATWASHRGVPLEVVMQSTDRTPRLDFEAWVADRYDLVWFERAAMFELMGRPRLGPTVVDLVDLEDAKALLRARTLRAELSLRDVRTTLRAAAAWMQTRVNARDWRQFQRSVARDVDRVVLSSSLDVQRSGLPNAAMVPNTYARPPHPVGHLNVGTPSVVLFQATFDYAPNVDAVDWLLTEVQPRLSARRHDVQIRLVGKPVPGVTCRHRPPGITVVGVAPSMGPEMARADIAVVPLRFASGTRLKILESFAHRVPVVSTTIGAEGLHVEHGVHLLLADDPEDFAIACERLLSEPALRKRLVDAAEERYLEEYECAAARARIEDLARQVSGDGPS